MNIQARLRPKNEGRFSYGSLPQINYVKGDVQRLETSRGCLHMCPYCKEPEEVEVFEIPEITKKFVQILDMNLLWQPNVGNRIWDLQRKGVKYEAVCGVDYRLLTQEIAANMKDARFIKVRIAWDWYIKDQYKIRDALKLLKNAGYRSRELSVFMLVNWKINKKECERKLDLLKVWNIGVRDCCYDGGYKYAVPEFWSGQEIKEFRARCRTHNQIVRHRIYPEE